MKQRFPSLVRALGRLFPQRSRRIVLSVLAAVGTAIDVRSRLATRRVRRRASRGDFRGGEILAVRFDGFSPRLGELLNAWRISQATGARLKFCWPETGVDGALEPELIFSSEFVAGHLLRSADLANYHPVEEWRTADLDRLVDDGARGVLLQSKQNHHGRGKLVIATRGFDFSDLPSMKTAYWQLPLQPRLEAVRRAVRDSEPAAGTAIHIRRGDIASGWFRLGGGWAKKAIPAPLVRELVAQRPDRRALLVGAQLEGVRAYCSDVETVSSSEAFPELPTEMTIAEALIRDLTALSMVQHVISGRSLFARLGSMIGGKEPFEVNDLISPARTTELLMAAAKDAVLSGERSTEVALTCQYLRGVALAPGDREPDELLLPICRTSDPLNPVYVVAGAANALRKGKGRDAGETLEAALADPEIAQVLLKLMRFELDLDRGPGWSTMTTRRGFLRPDDWRLLESLTDVPAAHVFIACQKIAERDFLAYAKHARKVRDSVSGTSASELVGLILDLPAAVPDQIGGYAITARSSAIERA